MSPLAGILNPAESVSQPEILAVDAEALDEHMSSSPEDDEDMTPASDEEIDELEEEIDDEEDDYDELSRSSKKSADVDSVGVADESALEEDEAKPSDTAKLSSDKSKGVKSRKMAGKRTRSERHDKRIDLGLLDHRAHPHCPDTLACLPDTNGRPQHTLPVILRCAILGSPRKRLTIREIYATMETKYPFYKTAGQTWKQSVRHHLSLNRLFERQPRPVTDPGFGSYWTVNLLAPPGTKRPRKRGRQNKLEPGNPPPSIDGQSVDGDLQSNFSHPTRYQFQPQTHPPPPPAPLPEPTVKSFNNPRAHNQYLPGILPAFGQNSYIAMYDYSSQPSTSSSQQTCPPSKKRQQHGNVGRLPNGGTHSHRASQFRPLPHYSHSVRGAERQGFKQLQIDSHEMSTSGQASAYPLSSRESETDENNGVNRAENKASLVTISEDEYDSDGNATRNREKRSVMTTAFIPTRPSPIFILPEMSGDDVKDNLVDHMRQEIANLRRTSAEAVSTSIRLSEQLANAHFEVARYRETVRELEDMLQDEGMKRRDAERQREAEAERRRAAEQAIGTMTVRPPPPNRMRPT